MTGKLAILCAGVLAFALSGCASSGSPMIPTGTGPNGLSIAEQSVYVANGGAVGGANR
jgi:hypothetical protein